MNESKYKARFKLGLTMLAIATVIWVIALYSLQEPFIYRLCTLAAGEFLAAVWAILGLHVFIYKVWPRLKASLKKKAVMVALLIMLMWEASNVAPGLAYITDKPAIVVNV